MDAKLVGEKRGFFFTTKITHMKHAINLTDFENWLNTQSYVYACDSSSKKKIAVDLRGNIKIYKEMVVVADTTDRTFAIETYNNL
jgi:hypothetical protein